MSNSFKKYSDILLEAFRSTTKSDDIASKKNEILDDIFSYYNSDASDVLFVGFSPALLKINNREVSVTQISPTVQKFLSDNSVQFNYIDFDQIKGKKFSGVIAVDEYFTFADTDQKQRELVNELIGLARDFVVTSLKDYKNQDYREKEFSHPVLVQGPDTKKIFFEHYEYNLNDRNACIGTSYIVDDESVIVVGPFERRAMYFKQLAKFSLDAGAKNFLVHKNLMHKSMIKKNYEHIISIQI